MTRLRTAFGVIVPIVAVFTWRPSGFERPSTPIAQSDTVVRLAGIPKYKNSQLVAEHTFGSDTSDLWLGDVNGALIARDGLVWVSQGGRSPSQPPSIVLFDTAGKVIKRLGARGSGPGEFRIPSGPAQLRDGRIIFRDAGIPNRFTLYRPNGALDTIWTLDVQIRGGPVNPAPIVDSAGVIWVEHRPLGPPSAPGRAFVRLDAKGQILDTVPYPELPPTAPSNSDFVPPYWPRVGAGVTWTGDVATYVGSRYAIDLRVATRRGRTASVRTWRTGDRVISVRRDAQSVPIGPEELREQQALYDAAAKASGATQRPDLPRVKPLIRDLRFGADGRIWVGVSAPSQRTNLPDDEIGPRPPGMPVVHWLETPTYDVFESDGTLLGTLSLPVNSYPIYVNGPTLLCLLVDKDGFMTLKRYRIIWSQA